MAREDEAASRRLWALARRQHWVVTRAQLLEGGLTPAGVRHRLERGRLHPLWRGVYAVGRPDPGPRGRLLGAVLITGPEAMASHHSAAALWGFAERGSRPLEVLTPRAVSGRRAGIHVRRRLVPVPGERRSVDRIPLTDPASTLVDVACELDTEELEAAVNAADRLDLIDPERLRSALDRMPPRAGVGPLRKLLDRDTFVRTDSRLERRFLDLVDGAGLPRPATQQRTGRWRVDFIWPELGLVVETDGLRYHRTAAQQAKDLRRDQDHAMAGLETLRFGHSQIEFEPERVARTLAAKLRALERRRGVDTWEP